jgi:hypothetical protein
MPIFLVLPVIAGVAAVAAATNEYIKKRRAKVAARVENFNKEAAGHLHQPLEYHFITDPRLLEDEARLSRDSASSHPAASQHLDKENEAGGGTPPPYRLISSDQTRMTIAALHYKGPKAHHHLFGHGEVENKKKKKRWFGRNRRPNNRFDEEKSEVTVNDHSYHRSNKHVVAPSSSYGGETAAEQDRRSSLEVLPYYDYNMPTSNFEIESSYHSHNYTDAGHYHSHYHEAYGYNRGICHGCESSVLDAILFPCGHQALCFECALNLQRSSAAPRCPVCMTLITHVQSM